MYPLGCAAQHPLGNHCAAGMQRYIDFMQKGPCEGKAGLLGRTCVTIWLSLHLTHGRHSHSPNTVRRFDCFCTHDARFGVAAIVWNASTAHYPLFHRHCVCGGGDGRVRQVVASWHCGRRPEGIAAKQPHPHLWSGPIFRRLYRGRHWWEGGRPPHRRLHAQPSRSKKVRPSAGEGGRPQVR